MRTAISASAREGRIVSRAEGVGARFFFTGACIGSSHTAHVWRIGERSRRKVPVVPLGEGNFLAIFASSRNLMVALRLADKLAGKGKST